MQRFSRAQSGLEYLMTYGWSLILIVSIASVLFFIFSSNIASQPVFSSSNPAKILLKSGNVTTNAVELYLQNATGGRLNITSLSSTEYSSCTVNGSAPPVNIDGGGTMKVNCTAPASGKGNLQINYTDFSGNAKSVSVSSSGTSSAVSSPPADECSLPADCNDSIACTIDDCSGVPKVCSNTPIIACTNSDSCCPTGCIFSTDNDCSDTCLLATQCNDSNSCTIDDCSGNPKNCHNNPIVACLNSDGCCPAGCILSTDNDCTDACLSAADCDDSNSCNIDVCSGSPKACSHTPKACIHNDGCCPTGCSFLTDNDCIDPGMVAYFKFFEATGTTIADSSGHGNTSTLVNGTIWQGSCPDRNCVGFDGVNDFVEAPDSASLDLTNLTVALWVFPSATKTDWQPIITKENATGAQRNYGLFITPNLMSVHFSVMSADCVTWNSFTSTGSMTLGQWNHIAMTYNGSQLIFYLNGNPNSTQAVSGAICQNNFSLKMGAETSTYTKFIGKIDEVKIFNRPLSASEILGLKNQFTPP